MTEQAVGSGIGRDAATVLDATVARAYRVAPIAVEDGELVLGMPDASDTRALRALRMLAGMDVRAVSMSAAEIADAQRDIYGDVAAPAGPARPTTPRESARERERCRVAAQRAGVQLVKLRPRRDGRDPVDPAAAQLLDEGFCRHFKIVAVAADNGIVVLATANPADTDTVRAAALMAAGQALLVAAAPSDIEDAITRAFSTPVAPPGERARAGRRKLGEMLLDSGLLDDDGLAQALRTQERTGDPLGEILVHSGIVEEERLAAALAEKLDLPLVTIDPARLDAEAVALIPHELMLRHRLVPIAVRNGRLVVAMVDPLDDAALATLAEHVELPLRPVLATDTDIDGAIQAITATAHGEAAASRLMRNMPEESAHQVLSGRQRLFFAALLVIGLASLVAWPIPTLVAFNVVSILFYMSFSIYRFRLTYHSFGHQAELPISDSEVEQLDERTLPVYTILVPLYREVAVLPHLMRAIDALDYPAARLDVKLLLEEDDEETLVALRALDPPPHFKILVVPDVGPRTKPKACNYGLSQARGEYTVIYDAEDAPEADQLKKIVVAFSKAREEVACIQCKLNYYNQRQNLLTRWFTCEYSMWFDLLLPGLDASGAPIPLGGTSNHFKTEQLIELGAWDPFNVTEDADLGVRLHKSGHQTAIIDSTTYEEANSYVGNWTRQRSRWVKGYIQTWLVQMRHPIRLLRQIGLRRWISFHLTVGGTPAIFLLNPIYWALTTAWLLTEAGVIKATFPGLLYYVAGLGLYVGNFLFAYMSAAGASRRGYHDLVKFALLAPLYWVLMSIGAWKGFIQLFTKPFYWEKTVHGLHLDRDGRAAAAPASAWIALRRR